jgi:uncharacterized protein YecE (DUF72 family)
MARPDRARLCIHLEGYEFITHGKRLSERSENSLDLLESRISLLRGKVGPILFQLPPQFEATPRSAGVLLQASLQEAPADARALREPL